MGDMETKIAKLESLHRELAELYRGKSVDTRLIEKLWYAVEVLERDLGVEA